MKILSSLVFYSLLFSNSSFAFCGFYVAKADSSLYNKASQVVLARDGDRTVISMVNDYQGDVAEFALVVPVPTILKKDQVHVGDRAIFQKLDAFSAPRLVEYFDSDPCAPQIQAMDFAGARNLPLGEGKPKSLGVKVEEQFTVGEYDIVILSADESNGLETWLTQNGYKMPTGAAEALAPYIKQNLKFFVAKVNLEEFNKGGFQYLRPLQFAFESPKFMLPLRLGMLNANGPQDLIVYTLTKKGRVESTNYRTTKVPSDIDIPLFVKNDFGNVYKALFQRAVDKESNKAIFTEYFWDMGWCDPCAGDPLTTKEMRELGAFWVNDSQPSNGRFGFTPPTSVILTRLHVQYTKESFPEDLMFQETEDKAFFQGKYVMRHPWTGDRNSCSQAKEYFNQLPERQEKEYQNLAQLTGWEIEDIRKKGGAKGPPPVGTPWWKNIWG